jgi:hypothetical protein
MRQNLQWFRFPIFQTPHLDMDRTLSFTDSGWNPHLESWKEFEDCLSKAFERSVQKYRSDVEHFLLKAKWKPTADIRQRDHFDWLALYQVRGYSPSRIADELIQKHINKTENTVLKAVTKTAGLIGLTLRPNQKGKGTKFRLVPKDPTRKYGSVLYEKSPTR